ncbi:transcription factor E2F7 [Myotis myotis]|uniref:Transcription factor E2F7 n=1 Tax=Myotis myotis TaxID=51298 RepID=A0A7J7Z216_MYOMY|nr:transcription factor E2F7 [Myotis myotis]KAF6368241.1 E2F transcription factor 7 [Myotis myotis]
MEVNCLTLKDLINPRQPRLDFATEDGENAQKENIFVDRSRMAPKTPIKNEPIDLSKQKIFTPEKNPITPVKLVDRQQTEPWTPTANLKMLISAASPDIRDWEKKKGLFRPIENKDEVFTDSLQLRVVGDVAVEKFEKRRPSRKQKSLGLLCQKFLARYPSYPLSAEKTTISLDEVAVSLGVERRRIYDIVNVLESLHLVSRLAKNQYGWHGRHSLPRTLRNLQRLGEEQKYEEQMASLQQRELDLMDYKFGERKKDGCADPHDQQLLDFSEPDCPSSSANRKDKSLRIMSQKFVMLFLVSKTKIVTLDVAAKILIEGSQNVLDHSKFKTKVRRLYDIANVLTSLALIKKVHVTEERGRKPAFKWIGPVDFASSDEELVDVAASVLPELKSEMYSKVHVCAAQKLARRGSFNRVPASERSHRKVNSGPSSPSREEQGPGGFLEIGSLAAIYQQQIEDKPQGKALDGEGVTLPSSSLDPAAPLPVHPVDSEYCVNPLVHQVFSARPQTDLQAFSTQNGLNRQVGVSLASAASDVESLKPGLLAGQPLLYVPSTSLFMLCGSLREGPLPEPGSERDSRGSEASAAALWSTPAAQKRLSEERQLPEEEEEEPAAKRQSRGYEDGPLSLVMPKKSADSSDVASPKMRGNRASVFLEDMPLNSHLPAARGVWGKAPAHAFVSSEWGSLPRNTETEKPLQENEGTTEPSLLQCLYVQPPAGLNGLNVLLPGSQTPHAMRPPSGQLPPLGVPCMVLPSSTLGPFPVLYSPTMAGPVSPAPGTVPNMGPGNFRLPGLGSTPHLLIGPAALVNPNSSTLSPADPQLQGPHSLNQSPVMSRPHNATQPTSPVYEGHPGSVVKLQQSPTPGTPKSTRHTHCETFFKTPGSLGDRVLRRRESKQSQSASSAQRRLEIPSGGAH